jgi:probable rRNA maturation factor
MTVEVVNESEVEVDLVQTRQITEFAITALKLHPAVDVAITFIDEAPMTELHLKWMDEPGPTDVLSFPMDELRPGSIADSETNGVLGDIVVCPQVANAQAQLAGHSMMHEVLVLVTHGMLHLVGFDHAEPDEEKEMFGLQAQIISDFLGKDS